MIVCNEDVTGKSDINIATPVKSNRDDIEGDRDQLNHSAVSIKSLTEKHVIAALEHQQNVESESEYDADDEAAKLTLETIINPITLSYVTQFDFFM
jgi:hypothetical protein